MVAHSPVPSFLGGGARISLAFDHHGGVPGAQKQCFAQRVGLSRGRPSDLLPLAALRVGLQPLTPEPRAGASSQDPAQRARGEQKASGDSLLEGGARVTQGSQLLLGPETREGSRPHMKWALRRRCAWGQLA